jgi:hypothetical protein
MCVGECRAGDARCSGADQLTPQHCDDTGTWLSGTPCPNLCADGTCGGTCMPGVRRCNPLTGLPELCTPMGTWSKQPACPFVCTGAGLCTGDCKPGARDCLNGVPRSCDPNGKWLAGNACPNVCTGDGVCSGECKPKAQDCDDQTPITCDEAGFWHEGTPCKDSACNAGVCTGGCTPGKHECGANQTPQHCDDSGKWVLESRCKFVCTGDGVCGGTCTPGEKTCSGVIAQTCRSDGSGYDTKTCMPAQDNETATCSKAVCGSVCKASPGKCSGSTKCWSLRDGCDQCVAGYVPRMATSTDKICVSSATHDLVQMENSLAASRVTDDPNLIAMYGQDACQTGYVWREAVTGDHVCVTGDRRTQSQNENAAHKSHTVVGSNP